MSRFAVGDQVWWYPVISAVPDPHRIACVIRSGPWTVGAFPEEVGCTRYLLRRVDGSVITGGVCAEHLVAREEQ